MITVMWLGVVGILCLAIGYAISYIKREEEERERIQKYIRTIKNYNE